MREQRASIGRVYKRRQIGEVINFAVSRIPGVDKTTLETFQDLVYTEGTYGEVDVEQIVSKMNLTKKYLPNVCHYSLLVIADLLEIDQAAWPGLALSPTLPGVPARKAQPSISGAPQKAQTVTERRSIRAGL